MHEPITKTLTSAINETEKTIVPIRMTLFRRFPIVFTALVAFGAGATFYGLERGFETIPFFFDHPWRTLLIGLAVLFATGKVYAKLG